jgi:hypothetical protein
VATTHLLTDPDQRRRAVEAVAWFSRFVHSWKTGNRPEAEEAREHLRRLGITVEAPEGREATHA